MPLLPAGGERKRIERAILSAIAEFGLDLAGIRVLTEAATGPFAVTAIAAGLSGADRVIAVTQDSRFGRAADVAAEFRQWIDDLDLTERIIVQSGRPALPRGEIDLVTNLGFVRPIDEAILSKLSAAAAVALMWEPWEARAADIDFLAARNRGIPIVGTNETDPRIGTFDYLGMLAAKLLLEKRCAILGTTVAVVGSDPFGAAIVTTLSTMGASVHRYDPESNQLSIRNWYASLEGVLDAVVVAEHRSNRILIGDAEGLPSGTLAADGVLVIHICGAVDAAAMHRAGLECHPANPEAVGRMTVTTGYVAAKPVIDLHVAGLRVAEIVVRSRRAGLSASDAVAAAVASGLGIAMPDESSQQVSGPLSAEGEL